MQTFTEWLEKNMKKNNCGILAPPMTETDSLDFMYEYLCDDKTDPCIWDVKNYKYRNSERVHIILLKYSRRYRKEVRSTMSLIDYIIFSIRGTLPHRFQPLSDMEAWEIIYKYLLGENWYSMSGAVHPHQINTEMVQRILLKYSRRYRKEFKERKKHLRG